MDFSFDGDFLVDVQGDLKDTSDDLIRSLENEIKSCMKSDYGDWKGAPSFTASLSEFRGQPNTRKTGEAIRRSVFVALTSNSLVSPEDLQVEVTPIGIHEVLIIIKVSAASTPNNRLSFGEPLVIGVTYSTIENDVWFVDISKEERNYFFG